MLEAIGQDTAQRLLDDVPRDEGGRVERALFLAAGLVLFLASRFDKAVQFVADLFQVGDRLLENVAEDFDVDQRGMTIRIGLGGDFGGRSIFVFAQIAKVGTDRVRHLQAVDQRVVSKQPAVVLRDFQMVVADVDRMEQASEVFPDRSRVVRIAVFERLALRVVGQQAAVFAKRGEQNTVEQFLCGGQHGVT